jgi:hypothetical protein
MSYKYQDKTYSDLPTLLSFLELDAGSGVPDGAEYQHDVLPAHDPAMQYVTWQHEPGGNWALVVVDKPLFARVVDGIVTDTNPAAAYDGVPVDRMTLEQMEEAERWHDVPPSLRRHIRPGWRQVGDSFEPQSVQHLQRDLRAGAETMAEDARNAIAQPVGMAEIGLWMMNYVGVAMHLAGQQTPLWDMAVAVEAGVTGETVDALRATHIAKAKAYHGMGALSQGMARQAKAAFVSDDVATLVATADTLRATAQAAMRDPQAAIQNILQG